MDTLFGDLARLVSASDLDHFEVLSFNPGYGWYYTQGQFTIFQNTDRVINSWQVPSVGRLTSCRLTLSCVILCQQATLAESLLFGSPRMWDEQGFSDWALYQSDLRIKLAPLQVSGLRVSRFSFSSTLGSFLPD